MYPVLKVRLSIVVFKINVTIYLLWDLKVDGKSWKDGYLLVLATRKLRKNLKRHSLTDVFWLSADSIRSVLVFILPSRQWSRRDKITLVDSHAVYFLLWPFHATKPPVVYCLADHDSVIWLAVVPLKKWRTRHRSDTETITGEWTITTIIITAWNQLSHSTRMNKQQVACDEIAMCCRWTRNVLNLC